MKRAFHLIFLFVLVFSSIAATTEPGPTNAKQSDKDKMLIDAAWQGDIDAVQKALKRGASVLAADDQGMTALIAATYRNDVAIAEMLMKAGADVNQKDNSQNNAFLIAAREGFTEILNLTLAYGADVNAVDSSDANALHRAGWRGMLEAVKVLLKTDIDINHLNNRHRTPLMMTMTSGGPTPYPGPHSTRIVETVRLLVEAGADTTIPDASGLTPLQYAQNRGATEVVEILIAGAVPLDQQLVDAVWDGDIELVKHLLTKGASVTYQDAHGKTALIAAADRNYVDIAKVLIEAGADVNTKDRTHQSAYLIATSEPFLELLKLTLANGADVHSLDSWNGTGLIRAAERGYFDIIAELLKTDIVIDHVNNVGWTALIEATNRSVGACDPAHTEVVRLLVEAGANVNLASTAGISPLDYAEMYGCTKMIEILKNAGATD